MTLNIWSSCLHLPRAGITDVCYLTCPMQCWVWMEPRTLCTLGKHSTTSAASSATNLYKKKITMGKLTIQGINQGKKERKMRELKKKKWAGGCFSTVPVKTGSLELREELQELGGFWRLPPPSCPSKEDKGQDPRIFIGRVLLFLFTATYLREGTWAHLPNTTGAVSHSLVFYHFLKTQRGDVKLWTVNLGSPFLRLLLY